METAFLDYVIANQAIRLKTVLVFSLYKNESTDNFTTGKHVGVHINSKVYIKYSWTHFCIAFAELISF